MCVDWVTLCIIIIVQEIIFKLEQFIYLHVKSKMAAVGHKTIMNLAAKAQPLM